MYIHVYTSNFNMCVRTYVRACVRARTCVSCVCLYIRIHARAHTSNSRKQNFFFSYYSNDALIITRTHHPTTYYIRPLNKLLVIVVQPIQRSAIVLFITINLLSVFSLA